MQKAISFPIADFTPSRWLATLANTSFVWQERAEQRYRLAALDDYRLQDLGLSRADAAAEAAKPFWRP